MNLSIKLPPALKDIVGKNVIFDKKIVGKIRKYDDVTGVTELDLNTKLNLNLPNYDFRRISVGMKKFFSKREKTQKEKFIKFFEENGVSYNDEKDERNSYHVENLGSYITVSQTIFCFDKRGKYLGAVADDMGFFQPVIKQSLTLKIWLKKNVRRK